MRPDSTGVAGGPVAGRAVGTSERTLDATDRAILAVLAADGRIANNALSEQVGIAASTCLTRVRALRESGVIRGVHADIDPAAVGLPLQAMIAVRVQAGSRDHLMDFAERVRRRPEVRSVYFLAGADDFLVHVAAADSAALRNFVVDQLSAHQQVALTETNLIFEHLRGAGLPD
ncbi:MAG: Lrp/AsnC family transcriptional regulator [Actinomycetota bacterium]|nr:Lrp/AsnC family transcriptional regulator [Actinomycetota bacterium]